MEAKEAIYADMEGNIVELGPDPDKHAFLLVAKGMEIPPDVEERLKKKKGNEHHAHAKKKT